MMDFGKHLKGSIMRKNHARKNRAASILRFLIVVTLASAVGILAGVVLADSGGKLLNSLSNEPKTASPAPSPSAAAPASPFPSNDKQGPDKPAPGMKPSSECLPTKFKFASEVLVNGKPVSNFKRDFELDFGNGEQYSALEGITAFRGNNYRDTASYGTADVKLKKLEKVWWVRTGYIDIWTGVGWTGQPSIVQWLPEVRKIMNIFPAKRSKESLKEVIYATLDGNIYFLDLEDGKPTRKPIEVGYPHKGSVMVDPRGIPLLYAGQGIPDKQGKPVPIGFRIFSLIDQKLLHFIDGRDKDAYRHWGAFDAGALVDANSDAMVLAGENGILYSGKLNTDFKPEKKSISIRPEWVKYRYRSPIGPKIGTENSPVVYRNYIYFADNTGLFQCLDLKTLKPVWIRDVTDDTDSSTAIEESDEGVSLYTACELDHHGAAGASYIRKINALSGDILWEKRVACTYDSHTNGGALASPVVGKQDIRDLVIYNIAKTGTKKSKNNGSKLLALDKKTGREKWSITLDYYCWSSPVAVYDRNGTSYLLVCDSAGYMTLFEGATGRKLDSIALEANIEASPAVYENMIVVGTRGQKIWGIRIR